MPVSDRLVLPWRRHGIGPDRGAAGSPRAGGVFVGAEDPPEVAQSFMVTVLVAESLRRARAMMTRTSE